MKNGVFWPSFGLHNASNVSLNFSRQKTVVVKNGNYCTTKEHEKAAKAVSDLIWVTAGRFNHRKAKFQLNNVNDIPKNPFSVDAAHGQESLSRTCCPTIGLFKRVNAGRMLSGQYELSTKWGQFQAPACSPSTSLSWSFHWFFFAAWKYHGDGSRDLISKMRCGVVC